MAVRPRVIALSTTVCGSPASATIRVSFENLRAFSSAYEGAVP
jgi:hypothetical protein